MKTVLEAGSPAESDLTDNCPVGILRIGLPYLRDIVHRRMPRHMTIRPLGIDLANRRKLIAALNCRVLNYGAARTLYRQRRPICRSLYAVKAPADSKKHCQQCLDRKHCTGQVRLDLLFENCPYRLLLAYTSAKNFLLYSR
jgi:hypothetical protein